MYACMMPWAYMKRTALFLKEEQLNKLLALSDKTGAPVWVIVGRAAIGDAKLRKRFQES
jgi:hypothetical protein